MDFYRCHFYKTNYILKWLFVCFFIPDCWQRISSERKQKMEQQLQGIMVLNRQFEHVQNFLSWAVCSKSTVPFLFSKELVRVNAQPRILYMSFLSKVLFDLLNEQTGCYKNYSDWSFWTDQWKSVKKKKYHKQTMRRR